ANGVCGFRKFKIELAATCTPYTDDQIGAAITQSATVAANATEAVAQQVNDLSVTVGGNTADVNELQGAVAGLNGKTYAYLQEQIAASGSTPAVVQLLSGDGTSLAKFMAAAITLTNVMGSGAMVDVLTLVDGLAYFAGKVFIGSTIYLDPSVPALIVNTGSAALAIGGPFGSDNLIFWFGPAIAPASMTKANATIFFDAAGDARFTGSISAGTLSNSIQGTDTSTTATTTLGPFGTDGNPITIAWSYTYRRNGSRSPGSSTVSGVPTATVTLYQTVEGGAETAVASQNISGSTSAIDTGDGYAVLSETLSMSSTFTDSLGGTANRTYRVAVSNRVSATFGGSTYNGQADHLAQNISIVTSEA
ncbi:MAG: hypothetical protein ACYDD1_17100, partial [Caulobacteraceae bacterium]